MKRAFLVLLLVPLVGAVGASQTPQTPIGFTRTTIIDNPRVTVMRLTAEPGAREEVHTHPYDIVVVQLTRGEVEMTVGSEKLTGPRDPGFVVFIAKGTPHAAANVGKTPFDVIVTVIK
jgi:quercetin dioxygenase-like cupin family protein